MAYRTHTVENFNEGKNAWLDRDLPSTSGRFLLPGDTKGFVKVPHYGGTKTGDGTEVGVWTFGLSGCTVHFVAQFGQGHLGNWFFQHALAGKDDLSGVQQHVGNLGTCRGVLATNTSYTVEQEVDNFKTSLVGLPEDNIIVYVYKGMAAFGVRLSNPFAGMLGEPRVPLINE